MNLFADIRTLVLDCLQTMVHEGTLPDGLDMENVTVEPPRDAAHGDMATNAAMVLAKPAGLQPRVIAEALAAHLIADGRITGAEVAGPGFLNLRLAPSVWQGVVAAVLDAGTDFGRGDLGKGQRINVEYVSANPTGPLHVGHTRGAVFGDALASLLDFAGFDVTREYYINDGGAQVDVLARSVYLRYLEALGKEVDFEEGTYPGDYLIPVGEKLKEVKGDRYIGKPEADWLEEVARFRDRRDDGADPCRSQGAGCRDGCVLLGEVALRHRTHRSGDCGSAWQGADLRRRAGAAEGQAAGGLGAARADAFQVHRPWRRRGPPGAEIRRKLDLFCARHRLSLRQGQPRISMR